jgi:hypothetical protein
MSTRSKDRSSLCSFTFVDSRRCRMPRRAGHPYLCAFHARKEAQALAGQKAAEDIAYHLSGGYISACDVSSALGRLFSAVALGQIKPKTASTLAYLAQTIAQNLHLAQDEYINAFGTSTWRETIRTSHNQSADIGSPAPQSPPATTVEPESSEPEASETEDSESEGSEPEDTEPEDAESDDSTAMSEPENVVAGLKTRQPSSEMSDPKPIQAATESPASKPPSPTSS